jgi:hypothetical protein
MSVKDGQNNLRRIAEYLDRKTPLSNEDAKFLSDALNKIADGEDAKKALGVNAKRGERTSKTEQDRICESGIKKTLALGWIAAAKASEKERGLELTLEAAIGMIGEHDLNAFGLTEETLKTYWNSNPEKRGMVFKMPD